MCYVLVEAMYKIRSVAPVPTISICSIESTRQPGSVLLVKKRWKQAWEIGIIYENNFCYRTFYGSNNEKTNGITIFSPQKEENIRTHTNKPCWFWDAGRLKSFANKKRDLMMFLLLDFLHTNPKTAAPSSDRIDIVAAICLRPAIPSSVPSSSSPPRRRSFEATQPCRGLRGWLRFDRMENTWGLAENSSSLVFFWGGRSLLKNQDSMGK